MLTVYGEGRGFRVVWLLEELGLAYRLRPVDLLAVENDRDFLAINAARFIPALRQRRQCAKLAHDGHYGDFGRLSPWLTIKCTVKDVICYQRLPLCIRPLY